MFRGLLVILALAAPSAAYAGCTERAASDAPGPFAMICEGEKCEKTQLEVVCGNVRGATYVYHNQVTLELTAPSANAAATATASRNGVAMAFPKCTAIDEGACPEIKP